MITIDKSQGTATDQAEIWRGTVEEPATDPIRVVVDMAIGEDLDDITFTWTEGSHRAETNLIIPIERLKAIMEEL